MQPIQNSNTVDAGLSNRQLGANSILTPLPKTPPFSLIGTRVSPQGGARTGIVACALITPTDATQSGASNFQTGDSTLTSVDVTVAHLSKSVHIANPAGQLGLDAVAHLLPAAINELEADIATIVAGKYLTATLGATDSEVAEASFAVANLKVLIRASTAFPRVALMTTTALCGIAGDLDGGNYPGLVGVFEHNLTGASGYAVVTGPSGLVYINEQPSVVVTPSLKIDKITLPQSGLTAWRHVWFDLGTRTTWASVDLLFGCAIGDPAASAYAAPAP